MVFEDLSLEAKEAAIREVAKLLPTTDILQSIASIKADYITRQQVQTQMTDFISQEMSYFLNFHNFPTSTLIFSYFFMISDSSLINAKLII